MPRVLNKRYHFIPADAVYVGRPGPFGNPFPMQGEHTRDESCDKFDAWVITQPQLVARIKAELRGKDLVCWCTPKRCHAQTLLKIANEPENPQ